MLNRRMILVSESQNATHQRVITTSGNSGEDSGNLWWAWLCSGSGWFVGRLGCWKLIDFYRSFEDALREARGIEENP
jgi:hypothetical protein